MTCSTDCPAVRKAPMTVEHAENTCFFSQYRELLWCGYLVRQEPVIGTLDLLRTASLICNPIWSSETTRLNPFILAWHISSRPGRDIYWHQWGVHCVVCIASCSVNSIFGQLRPYLETISTIADWLLRSYNLIRSILCLCDAELKEYHITMTLQF